MPEGGPESEKDRYDRWQQRVSEALVTTVHFYDYRSANYVTRYSHPERLLVNMLDEIRDWSQIRGKPRAIDVGCGPGQYAEMLQMKGFEVVLVDKSRTMLSIASKRLGRKRPPEPLDITTIGEVYSEPEFDLVFACAMMIHVPKAKASDIYRDFYRMLRPGGVLFVNYKIRDHTLISMDERFFEYYADPEVPNEMLRREGFVPKTILQTHVGINSYGDPKQIYWANFYCIKPPDTER